MSTQVFYAPTSSHLHAAKARLPAAFAASAGENLLLGPGVLLVWFCSAYKVQQRGLRMLPTWRATCDNGLSLLTCCRMRLNFTSADSSRRLRSFCAAAACTQSALLDTSATVRSRRSKSSPSSSTRARNASPRTCRSSPRHFPSHLSDQAQRVHYPTVRKTRYIMYAQQYAHGSQSTSCGCTWQLSIIS